MCVILLLYIDIFKCLKIHNLYIYDYSRIYIYIYIYDYSRIYKDYVFLNI